MGDHLLTLEDIHKSFGSRRVLRGVRLRLGYGEVRFIIGPNGAGKTTLFQIIAGFLSADEGHIVYHGASLAKMPAYRRHRIGIAQAFQVPQLIGPLSVAENLLLCSLPARPLWKTCWGRRPSQAELDRVDLMLHRLGLTSLTNTRVDRVSHGTRKLIEVGAALIRSPRLLLLDEPTAGLDEGETLRMEAILRSLKGDTAVLIIEHDMAFVRAINEPITVLHDGMVLCEGRYADREVNTCLRGLYLGTTNTVETCP